MFNINNNNDNNHHITLIGVKTSWRARRVRGWSVSARLETAARSAARALRALETEATNGRRAR